MQNGETGLGRPMSAGGPENSLDGAETAPRKKRRPGKRRGKKNAAVENVKPPVRRAGPLSGRRFAALDLGTNNCRLLIAAPQQGGYRVVDAFSRIVRLGEGVSGAGVLSDAAMDRTIAALKVCADKIRRRAVTDARCIATQACRSAGNGADFLARVERETGLKLEIITPQEEARLALRGSAKLVDRTCDAVLVFDIGGGSTELSWARISDGDTSNKDGAPRRKLSIAAWTSMPHGVVTLAERFGGREISVETYEEMVRTVEVELKAFDGAEALRPLFDDGRAHLLGTSGTVTSLAGVSLKLPRYDRNQVDGHWLDVREAQRVCESLRSMGYEGRAEEPCIGAERADLVVAGGAILEAIIRQWPSERLRVADRGLREGVLAGLIAKHRRKKRRRVKGKKAKPKDRA